MQDYTKIRFNINNELLALLNRSKDINNMTTSDFLNYCVNYYFYSSSGIDVLGVLDLPFAKELK